jgi:hypothetical protein
MPEMAIVGSGYRPGTARVPHFSQFSAGLMGAVPGTRPPTEPYKEIHGKSTHTLMYLLFTGYCGYRYLSISILFNEIS